jgi:hypothetical protein
VAILAASGSIRTAALDGIAFVGELGLGGGCPAYCSQRMRRNFALEQAELDADFVLTCQSCQSRMS